MLKERAIFKLCDKNKRSTVRFSTCLVHSPKGDSKSDYYCYCYDDDDCCFLFSTTCKEQQGDKSLLSITIFFQLHVVLLVDGAEQPCPPDENLFQLNHHC